MSGKKFFTITIITLSIYTFFRVGNVSAPVEELDIPAIIGADIEKNLNGNNKFKLYSSIYNYSNDKLSKNIILEGTGNSIGETRSKRQLEAPAKFFPGLEKVLVIGKSMGDHGIMDLINSLFATETVTDNTFCIVSASESIDILNFNIEGFSNPGDYLEGMIKSSTNYNFFSNNYRLIDIYVRLDAEGRNVVLPYIQIEDNKLKIAGMAVFKGDKVNNILNIDESRAMNLMRESNVMGNINIKESPKESVDFVAKSKRKVKCSKSYDKYVFDISINLSGDVLGNTMYNNLSNSPEKIKALEKNISENIEKQCINFIKKMQNEHKVDALDLGRVAAAKYGRGKGVDWNEEVSNSIINVNVKTHIEKFGRGEY
ncbi:Ger(x)C family spore germination protein [Clostridium amazonitimonense]|uniref:Ger(x)C family spore germination protein n=1 Tax=Clostridium amazonitimonense TaxID=1499689 RepID=UPI000509CC6E|nr:Ger(x)C family spore germination protein [Clostridium amazonitimonense]